jgi:hypothetical protein
MRLVVILVLLAFVACGDDEPSAPPDQLHTVNPPPIAGPDRVAVGGAATWSTTSAGHHCAWEHATYVQLHWHPALLIDWVADTEVHLNHVTDYVTLYARSMCRVDSAIVSGYGFKVVEPVQ